MIDRRVANGVLIALVGALVVLLGVDVASESYQVPAALYALIGTVAGLNEAGHALRRNGRDDQQNQDPGSGETS